VTRSKKLTPEQERAVALEAEGKTAIEIATATDRSVSAVRDWRAKPAYQLALANKLAPLMDTVGPLAERAARRLGELVESADDKTAQAASKALVDAAHRGEQIASKAAGAKGGVQIVNVQVDEIGRDQAGFIKAIVLLRRDGFDEAAAHLVASPEDQFDAGLRRLGHEPSALGPADEL
jgi:hypothetical protein